MAWTLCEKKEDKHRSSTVFDTLIMQIDGCISQNSYESSNFLHDTSSLALGKVMRSTLLRIRIQQNPSSIPMSSFDEVHIIKP